MLSFELLPMMFASPWGIHRLVGVQRPVDIVGLLGRLGVVGAVGCLHGAIGVLGLSMSFACSTPLTRPRQKAKSSSKARLLEATETASIEAGSTTPND